MATNSFGKALGEVCVFHNSYLVFYSALPTLGSAFRQNMFPHALFWLKRLAVTAAPCDRLTHKSVIYANQYWHSQMKGEADAKRKPIPAFYGGETRTLSVPQWMFDFTTIHFFLKSLAWMGHCAPFSWQRPEINIKHWRHAPPTLDGIGGKNVLSFRIIH